MMIINGFVEEHSVPQEFAEGVAHLLTCLRQYMTPSEIERVRSALRLALDACIGVSGERSIPLFEHALAVATILAQMHIDAIGVSAGLAFEAVDADLLSLERVEQELGSVTARVVGSMARLNILERQKQNVAEGVASGQIAQLSGVRKNHDEREESSTKPRIRKAMRKQQAETVRKMFIAMAEDPRVVLLKLAYRLHAMRNMCQPSYQGDQQEMLTMALETREIYAPLAGRLGMSRVESELEDRAFQILEPDKYSWVQDIVELESKQWRSYVERVCGILRTEMDVIGVKAEVSGRVKHLYSFYKKIQRNADNVQDLEKLKEAVDINQIHDLIAFRILVDSTPDCYIVLGHVHSLWKPKEGRIKDFIANPKPNGYSALHTTVFCLDDQLAEIQIRTFAMHEMAEYGVAMHWHYKDVGDYASSSARELLTWLRQLAEWQRDLHSVNTSDTEFVEAVKDDIFQEQIFVFTPKGEVKDLPVGSTPLDFAYRVHTKIGDKCAGARIISQVGSDEGERLVTRMVPLDYELKSGEIVDIVTNRTAHPTRDWLNFARTAAARSKIRRYIKTHERHINIQIGQERLDRELKAAGIARGLEVMTEDAENWLCAEYHLEEFEDILSAIGADDIRPRAVVVKLNELWREGKEPKESKDTEELPVVVASVSAKSTTDARLQVAGVSGLLTKLANCCYPLPGDEVVGFVSRGKGVIVHRADCQNIARFRKQDRERIVAVNWVGMSQPRYLAPILITARDRAGLIRDVAAVITDASINLMSINSHAHKNREQVLITATLEVDNLDQLHRLFMRLEK
ncbi:MAG: bifunctional (p)ppGpp synthetase/guanosine-3',5'-bis(diphosphate) 3'-pyrophosphohydrolase, partial [Ktedonobacteraceae bacterium]|nr:bifunctional (p)ppGpp synthetase/guanosine-3',5'-bis(diphosphate) 3'-pyrophosphohydrolase [Ktedonobacteraceae bacterium]